MVYKKLFAELRKISTFKEKDTIFAEWEYINNYSSPAVEHCLCGHEINVVYIVRNKITHQEIKIGSECINHFTKKYPSSYALTESQKRFRNYTTIQELRMKNSKKPRMDLIDRLAEVSHTAFKIFNQIKLNTDRKTLISVMDEFNDIPANKKSTFYKRISELRRHDLVIKLRKLEMYPSADPSIEFITLVPKKFSFMLNPYLILPEDKKQSKTNYNRAKYMWQMNKKDFD